MIGLVFVFGRSSPLVMAEMTNFTLYASLAWTPLITGHMAAPTVEAGMVYFSSFRALFLLARRVSLVVLRAIFLFKLGIQSILGGIIERRVIIARSTCRCRKEVGVSRVIARHCRVGRKRRGRVAISSEPTPEDAGVYSSLPVSRYFQSLMGRFLEHVSFRTRHPTEPASLKHRKLCNIHTDCFRSSYFHHNVGVLPASPEVSSRL